MIIILIVQALFGLVSPLNKQALTLCSAAFFVAGKLLSAGILLLLYHFYRHGALSTIPRRHWPYYFQIIVIGNFCAHFLKYWGLQHVSATKMALIFNTSPFFVALFSYFFFGNRLTRMQCAGLFISFIGLIPVLVGSCPEELHMGEFCTLSWPEFAIIVATIFHALSMISKRILMQENAYWPVQVNAISFLGGGLLAALYVGVMQADNLPDVNVLPVLTGYILLTTIISKVICSTLYLRLMKYYTTTFLAFMDYWYVLFVAFWSWLFWGEHVTMYFWLSALIVFCGQYLFYRQELYATKAHSEPLNVEEEQEEELEPEE